MVPVLVEQQPLQLQSHQHHPGDKEMAGAIKLRLHYQGQFYKENGSWAYSGGEVFNESVPRSFKYSDLCRKLNDKFCDTVSFKYLAPGEDLDPSNLIAVGDDDDLQELYDEYDTALRRPGTPLKTFRIKVYVFPACQFVREDLNEDEAMLVQGLASMDDSTYADPEGPNFDDYDYGGSEGTMATEASVMPSSDTEVQMQQTMNNNLAHWPAPALYGEPVGHHFPMPPMPPAIQHAAVWEDMAFNNISKSITKHSITRHMQPQWVLEKPFTADDFQVEDPYSEQEQDAAATSSGGFAATHPAVGGAVAGTAGAAAAVEDGLLSHLHMHMQERAGALERQYFQPQLQHGQQQLLLFQPVYAVPAAQLLPQQQRKLCDTANLPSHISIFGDDGGDTGCCGLGAGQPAAGGAARGASLNLPSHISVFGEAEGSQQQQQVASLLKQVPRLHAVAENGGAPALAPQTWGYPMEDSAIADGRDSKCITQEFGQTEMSMVPNPLAPLDFDMQNRSANDMDEPSPGSLALQGVVKKRREEVCIVRKIGEGAFGEVSQANVFPYGSVAIKWLKRDRFAKYSESFQREAEVLAKLNHPNIIRMYGLVVEGSASKEAIAGIMTEFVRGGSLTQLLRSLRRRLTLKERCRIALHATLGMAYLHDQSPAVIHFDLKPDNLLVDGEGDNIVVKVADFGLSKHKFHSHVSCRDLRGTLPYMAPELVNNPNMVSEKCDVWSMGVVMWELLTLEVPFCELSAQNILMALMKGRLHLAIPSSCDEEWRGLIEACMDADPAARPSFKQLATQLEALQRQLSGGVS